MERSREDPAAQQAVAQPISAMRRRAEHARAAGRADSERLEMSQSVQNLTDSTRSLQQVAHIASHDVQEPLRLVLSYVQQLKKKFRHKLGSQGDQLLGCVVDRATQVQDAINALSYAMHQVGAQHVEPALRATQAEFRIAQEIQQKLFPSQSPRLPGFDIAGATFPADCTGGDYFDFIPMVDRGLGVVVGDVSGHGLGPALLMIETRAILRSLALTVGDVGEILTQANGFLVQDTDKHFITLFFAHVDPDRQSLTYASGGHRGYLLRWRGNVEILDSTGVALGVIPDIRMPSSDRITLDEDDILLLLTDGIEEALSPAGECFGVRRIIELARFLRKEPANRIVEMLYKAVAQFTQRAKQQDDITAVVVKATGK
jgi:sigma-B regulation protein RsbU (phosphoserine phosphatase)